MSKELEYLRNKVQDLEKENELLRSGITSFLTTDKTVNVPEQFRPIFDSAEEVVKNGVKLKEMNVLLLKKIEELTLHMIKMQKKIETLEKRLSHKK